MMVAGIQGLLAVAGLIWAGGLLQAVRRRRRNPFRLDRASLGVHATTSVSVIVPARNEAGNIGSCVAGVLGQTGLDTEDAPVECSLLVLDDGSTDATWTELANSLAHADPGTAQAIQGGSAPLPEGWLGKPWACERAAKVAIERYQPEWLLFIDADVQLQQQAIAATVGYAQRNELAMVSGFGQLQMESFWERVMQPVISGLIIAGNDPIKVNDPEQRTESPLANGQFILIRRTVYEAIEGHAAVRQNVLDDVGLATAVTAAQFDYHLLFLTDLFSVRMYDSLGALWQGWTKNLFPGMGRNWSALFGLVAFQFCFVMLPLLTIIAALVGLVSTAWLVWALPGYVFLHLLRTYLDHIFGQRLWFGFTHELGSLMLAILLLVSAYQTTRGKAVWKGRVVE